MTDNATCQHCGERFRYPDTPTCPKCGTAENRMDSAAKEARAWNRCKWKKRTIGGVEINFPNKMEANYYRYLHWLDLKGEILGFEYQPKAFDFRPKHTKGTTSYKPDFKVWDNDCYTWYVETKGYMDAKSKTKLKRMAKLFPHVHVELVLYNDYKKLAAKVGALIEGWEK